MEAVLIRIFPVKWGYDPQAVHSAIKKVCQDRFRYLPSVTVIHDQLLVRAVALVQDYWKTVIALSEHFPGERFQLETISAPNYCEWQKQLIELWADWDVERIKLQDEQAKKDRLQSLTEEETQITSG